MSLFGNPEYQWRETYFVLFDIAQRPAASAVKDELAKLGRSFELDNIQANDAGLIESVTIDAPDDFAAMDVSFVSGEEVAEQIPELMRELKAVAEGPEELAQLEQIAACTARLDVFHFSRQVDQYDAEDEADDFMDPGSVLIVLQRLSELCGGIVVDPQSGSLL